MHSAIKCVGAVLCVVGIKISFEVEEIFFATECRWGFCYHLQGVEED